MSLAVLAAPCLLLGPVSGAATADAAEVIGPTAVCTVSDPRLAELSGLATDGGARRWAISDGGKRAQVFELARDCSVRRVVTGGVDPFDVEDLARGSDGTFWLADTGDNQHSRATVAMIELSPSGVARLHRMRYPDGPHDAEAVLLDSSDVPLVVTKEPFAAAGIYRPVQPLRSPGGTAGKGVSADAPVALSKVGQVVLPSSETIGGPVGGVGTRTITGGATTADRHVVALRTYTDAWLYPAPDGDLLAALRRTPVQIPLPGEPQGEAIAFDGRGTLLSGSETRDGVAGRLRTVVGAAAAVGATGPGDDSRTSLDRPSGDNSPRPAGGPSRVLLFGGVAILLAVGVMVVSLVVSRRRSRPWRR